MRQKKMTNQKTKTTSQQWSVIFCTTDFLRGFHKVRTLKILCNNLANLRKRNWYQKLESVHFSSKHPACMSPYALPWPTPPAYVLYSRRTSFITKNIDRIWRFWHKVWLLTEISLLGVVLFWYVLSKYILLRQMRLNI